MTRVLYMRPLRVGEAMEFDADHRKDSPYHRTPKLSPRDEVVLLGDDPGDDDDEVIHHRDRPTWMQGLQEVLWCQSPYWLYMVALVCAMVLLSMGYTVRKRPEDGGAPTSRLDTWVDLQLLGGCLGWMMRAGAWVTMLLQLSATKTLLKVSRTASWRV